MTRRPKGGVARKRRRGKAAGRKESSAAVGVNGAPRPEASRTSPESAEEAHRREWEKQVAYFEGARAELMEDKRYRGRFVAIRENRVIDTDEDKFTLARRLCRTHPDETVLIAKADVEPPVMELPSPEFDHGP